MTVQELRLFQSEVWSGFPSCLDRTACGAGSVTGAATEWTQLANNAELVAILESSGIQVDKSADPDQPACSANSNQLDIYRTMLETARLRPMSGVMSKQTSAD